MLLCSPTHLADRLVSFSFVFVLFVLLGPEIADLHPARILARGHSIFIFQCLVSSAPTTHSICLLVLPPPLFALHPSPRILPTACSPSRRHAPSSLCSCLCLCPSHTTFYARAMASTAAACGFVAPCGGNSPSYSSSMLEGRAAVGGRRNKKRSKGSVTVCIAPAYANAWP